MIQSPLKTISFDVAACIPSSISHRGLVPKWKKNNVRDRSNKMRIKRNSAFRVLFLDSTSVKRSRAKSVVLFLRKPAADNVPAVSALFNFRPCSPHSGLKIRERVIHAPTRIQGLPPTSLLAGFTSKRFFLWRSPRRVPYPEISDCRNSLPVPAKELFPPAEDDPLSWLFTMGATLRLPSSISSALVNTSSG